MFSRLTHKIALVALFGHLNHTLKCMYAIALEQLASSTNFLHFWKRSKLVLQGYLVYIVSILQVVKGIQTGSNFCIYLFVCFTWKCMYAVLM